MQLYMLEFFTLLHIHLVFTSRKLSFCANISIFLSSRHSYFLSEVSHLINTVRRDDFISYVA